MIVVDTHAPVDRATYVNYRCVRCGFLPPSPWMFICGRCDADPDCLRERRYVEEFVLAYPDQRRHLVIAFDWAGGWWHG